MFNFYFKRLVETFNEKRKFTKRIKNCNLYLQQLSKKKTPVYQWLIKNREKIQWL